MQENIKTGRASISSYQFDDSLADVLPGNSTNAVARKQALASVARRQWGSTSVVSYQSAGKCLIMDRSREGMDQDRAVTIASGLTDAGIRTTVLINGIDADTHQCTQSLSTPAVTVITGELVELTGHLGQYAARFRNPGDLGVSFLDEHASFDLVLDLNSPPLLQREVLPPGYYAPGDDPQALQSALQEIPQMIGEFAKPVYVKYRANVCTHGNKGISGCTRCLDSCPAEAIREDGEKIAVNTSLCQGCGICTVSCPTGALSYAYPGVQEWLRMIRDLLEAYRQAGGTQADLLIYDHRSENAVRDQAGKLPDNLIPVAVDEIGSVGMDAWLSALAYGAGAVVLMIGNGTPVHVREKYNSELAVARDILMGMGYARQRLQSIVLHENTPIVFADQVTAGHPAAVFMPIEKRRTIRLALDHLSQHAPAPQQLTVLTEGAPFGEIQVDHNSCTLCMSCVGICPTQSLQHDVHQLQLMFIESRCVQCGLCENACPEKSITLAARYLYDDAEAEKPRVLHEDEAFCCIVCGKPFTTQRMVDTLTARIAAANRNIVKNGVPPDWLLMCGDCRIK